jgi:hypothetical protein
VARGKKANPAAVTRAVEHWRSGCSLDGIVEKLKQEGMPLPRTTVQDAVKAAREAEAAQAGVSDTVPDVEFGQTSVEGLEALAAALHAKIKHAIDQKDFATLKGFSPVYLEVCRTIPRVRPPEKVDPASDPNNLAAREELIGRMKRLGRELFETEQGKAAAMAHFQSK